MKRFIGVLLGALLILPAAVAAEPPYRLTMAGGAPRGVWSLIGTGLNSALGTAYPGSNLTYQASASGGLANIPMVAQGRVPLALAEDAGIAKAWKGEDPFKSPMKNIRVIGFVAGWLPMFLAVEQGFAEEYGLNDFSDIAKKKPPIRVAINRRSNLAAMVSLEMLKQIGVSPADIEKWGGQVVYQPSPEQANLMLDGRIDMIFNQVPVGHSTIRQVQESVKLKMLTIDPDLSEKVAERVGLQTFTIPAKAHAWQEKDLTVPSLGTTLIASASMPDQTAYDLAKAIVEHMDKIQASHPFLKQLTPQFLTTLKTVPYHPGAVKYYKEKGLM